MLDVIHLEGILLKHLRIVLKLLDDLLELLLIVPKPVFDSIQVEVFWEVFLRWCHFQAEVSFLEVEGGVTR
jgi:hypothetical protein